MLRYGFFDSEITGFDDFGMPEFDRAESSDFLAAFLSRIISSGVLGQPGDCFQVVAGEGMALRVMPGFAVIQGRFAMDGNAATVKLPQADASHGRIDRVVLRADYPRRLCEIAVKEGIPAERPVPPELLQPEAGDCYELCLATVAVGRRQGAVTQADITDTRYDSSVCGVVTQVIDHLDTGVLFAQLSAFYQDFVRMADAAYEEFGADTQACLDAQQAALDRKVAEMGVQFAEWFGSVRDQVTGDMAVQLQSRIGGHMEDDSRHTAPSAGAANKVWKTDAAGVPGWRDDKDTTYSTMRGSTASAGGAAGLVPAPAAGAADKYLRNDGTWAVPPDTNTTYGTMRGSTASAGGAAGLVPAPAAGAADKYLRNDGTWAALPNAEAVKDSGDSGAITFAYSKAGLNSTSWLAGWNGKELRAISPNNVTAGGAKTLYIPRVSKNASYDPGQYKSILEEFDSGGSTNLPSAHFYHILTSQGSDTAYATQLAIGMTTEEVYYRKKSAGTWGAWRRLYHAGNLSKSTLGLGNVNDTSDANKPVSTAQQNALNLKQNIRNTQAGGAVDWNTLTTAGSYKIQNCTMTDAYHAPNGEYAFGILFVVDSESGGETRIAQIYYPHTASKYDMWTRMRNNGTWTEWKGMYSTAHPQTTVASATKATQDGSGNVITSTYAKKSIYGDGAISLGRFDGSSIVEVVIGTNSFACGYNCNASGNYSHAEGYGTTASGEGSHAEGRSTAANKNGSHAEGFKSFASGTYSHAEGDNTTASGEGSHAEGNNTTASSSYSHAEGTMTTSKGAHSHAEGYNTLAEGADSHAEGNSSTARGIEAHAEGHGAAASGECSHAEGRETTASGTYSHAEGLSTSAWNYCHAEGAYTNATNWTCHAEGSQTNASGNTSHAEGSRTTSSANNSHAEGDTTTASNYASHAGGKFNAAMTTGGDYNNTTGTAFVIGNGTGSSALSNAFSVQYSGVVKAKSTITGSTTADYAEYFEWEDGNPAFEDRVGLFVAMDGEKIHVASPDDSYILGIVSGEPFVLGNGDCDTWNGMFLRDEFNRVRYERAPKIDVTYKEEENEDGVVILVREEKPALDEDGNQLYYGTRPILNPDYDNTQPYVSRQDRPEWAAVGMVGVMSVRDDGTCRVNGFCKPSHGGIASDAGDTEYEIQGSCIVKRYRVVSRVNENIVRVLFR